MRGYCYADSVRGALKGGSFAVNQNLSPIGDNVFGIGWQSLGRFTLAQGASALVLQLTDEATAAPTGEPDRYVVADAVRLLEPETMTVYTYNSLGQLESTADALGNQTTHAYDALGRMVRVTQPDPDGAGSLAAPVSSSHYNGAGQLSAAIGPDLSVSTFEYDTLGRQTAAYRGGLVHNRARAYAETGAWSDGSNQGLFDTERVATTVTGSATAAATWTFGGLTVGDDYGVFLTWTADAGNAEDASIKIYAGSTGTTPIWTETVDMTQAPGAAQNSVLQPIDFAAKDFQRLDGVFTATAGTIIIELSNLSSTSGKKIVADTVYVVREDAVSQTVYDHAGRVWKTLDPEGYAATRTYDNLGRLVKVTQPDPDNGGNNPALVVEYAYLCMCQLGSVDVVGFFFRTGTEKRVGGAGGGASSPCSPARGGRNRARLQAVGAHAWQDAPARKVEAGGLPSRSDYAARLGGGFALSC